MIYYFLKRRKTRVSRDVSLEAYLVEPRIEDGKKIKKFRLLESIDFFQITPDGFIRYRHEFAYNDCHYAGAESYSKLKKAKEGFEKYPTDRKTYERYKKVLLAIYLKHNQGINFNIVKKPELAHYRTIL